MDSPFLSSGDENPLVKILGAPGRQGMMAARQGLDSGRTLGFPDAEPAHGPRGPGDPDRLVRIVQNSVEPARMANPEISTGRPAAAACAFAALNSHCSCLTPRVVTHSRDGVIVQTFWVTGASSETRCFATKRA
jgi:hypothetical protein